MARRYTPPPMMPGWGPQTTPTRPRWIGIALVAAAILGATFVLVRFGVLAFALAVGLGLLVQRSRRPGRDLAMMAAAGLLAAMVVGINAPVEKATAAPKKKVERAIKHRPKAEATAPGQLEEYRDKVADLYAQLATLFSTDPNTKERR